jgi:choline dehydrogenase
VHDYVIVGAGSAGCVLAARLSEDPETSVLLLEAGPADRKLKIKIPAAFSQLYGSDVDWALRTAPQAALHGREVFFPLGKMLGGSSSINAMMVLRGHPADQRPWPTGWSSADVEPFYRRSAGGPFPLAPACDPSPLTEAFVTSAAAEGLRRLDDLNGAETEGVGRVPLSQRRGRRFSVADGYLHPAQRRPNLTVVTEATATRLLVENGRVTGIAYRLDGNEEEATGAREVIVCAGAVGSPALLLRSGIGPAAELEELGLAVVRDLPGVGKGLRDHLANGIIAATHGVRTLASAESLPNLLRWLVAGRGPLTSNVAEAVAFVRTRPDLPGPDLELLFAPVPFEEEGLVPPSRDGLTLAAILLQPRSVGEVRLRSGDPLDPPVVDPCYLTDPDGHDLGVLVHGIRLARRVLAQEPLARHVQSELLPGADAQTDQALVEHIRERSQTLYHPVGTCRMGTDELAVVDPQLCVRRLDGLRVVDASVFPAIPRGHTNWPTVMVAERAADLIREANASRLPS